MEIPALARIYCEREKLNFMGGLHGLEHLLLALVPLFALCDRGDMGGVSFVEHLGARGPAIFLYDGYPGGVGLSERVFEVFGKLLEKASAVVKACPCEEGCPSCIHSPRCGSGNYPLDKDAVLSLLEFFTQQNAVLMADTAAVPEEKPATMEEIEELTPVSLISQQTKIEDKKMILIFDLETQLSAEEVGGWGNIAKMRLAVGVILELNSKKFRIYYEEDADSLIKDLEAGDLVIGFNLKRFDYTVLKMYGLENPGKIKTLDLMEDVTAKLGFRLSLDSLCSATLNEGKTGDGLQALKWFKQGELDKVTYYCQKDVELTRDLFLFGHNNGYVLFKDNKGRLNKVPVNWRNPG
jgi:DEAD/DEAH box helicase domain-containing protein